MWRCDSFGLWLNVNSDRIPFARKGYLNTLLDDYNYNHHEAPRKDNKPELWRWLDYFRKTYKVPTRYCLTKILKTRSPTKKSNFVKKLKNFVEKMFGDIDRLKGGNIYRYFI